MPDVEPLHVVEVGVAVLRAAVHRHRSDVRLHVSSFLASAVAVRPGIGGWFTGTVTAPDASPQHRRVVRLLTVLTAALWLVAFAAAATVSVLLLRVQAPADRTVAIVLGWFMTPAIPATGATIALVVARRAARTRGMRPAAGDDAH